MDPTKNVKEQHIRHKGITDALYNLDKAIDERIEHEMLYISEIKLRLTQLIRDLKPCVAEVSIATSLGPNPENVKKLDAVAKDIDVAASKLKSVGPFKNKYDTKLNAKNIADTVSTQSVNIKTKQTDGAPRILGQTDELFVPKQSVPRTVVQTDDEFELTPQMPQTDRSADRSADKWTDQKNHYGGKHKSKKNKKK
jgi:hypothetical protein